MVDKVLEQRGKVYGDFNIGTKCFSIIMEALNAIHCDKNGKPLNKEDEIKLYYIVMKLIRVAATPDHIDSWVNIQGYAKKIEETYRKGGVDE